MSEVRKNLAFFKWLSDEDGVTRPSPAQLEAMKRVCAKVLGCRTLGVPLPTAIVESMQDLRDESEMNGESDNG